MGLRSGMPTREQMIADIEARKQQEVPSREQMIADIQARKEPSTLSSLQTGAASGMTLGTTPIAAGLGAGAGSLYSNLVEQDTPTIESFKRALEAFKEGRAERNEFEQAQQEANPIASGVGNVAGLIGSAPLLPFKAAEAGAGVLGKLVNAGVQGGKAGGVYGLTSSAGSAESLEDAAKRVASGIGYGAGTGAVLSGAAQAAKGGYSAIKNLLANRAASKVANAPSGGIIKPETPKDIRQVLQQGADDIRPSPETEALNLKYKESGLEPLSPIQQQPKAYGEPTPAQYAETVLKSRDPKLYEQQLKQVQSYEKALDKYRNLGAPTKEAAGSEIKEGVLAGKKAAGKVIGKFKADVADVPVVAAEVPQVADDLAQMTLTDPISGKGIALGDRVKKLKTFKDLDDLSSDLYANKNQRYIANGYQNDRGTHAIGEYKDKIEKYIETFFPEGKPREAYKQYAQVKEILNDTLKGTLKTGGSDKVIKKITATGENYAQFKKVADGLGKPELVESVKDNYLSGIFNSKNWKLQWEKEVRSGEVIKQMLPKETVDKINLLVKYDQQMRSTMSGTVNPPRTGIVASMVEMSKKPVKSIVMDLVFGEKRQMKKTLDIYKNMVSGAKEQASKATASKVPLRKTGIVSSREMTRRANEE